VEKNGKNMSCTKTKVRVHFLIGVAIFLVAANPPAVAQDDLVFDISLTKSCLREASTAGEKRECIGESANACMRANSLGGSTYGMGGCLNFEAEWWDGQLNIVYKKLRRQEKADDEANAEFSDNLPKQAEALRDMQRAWIAYRDATCEYEYSQFGGGTGGGPAGIACTLHLTAAQAIYLHGSLQEF